MSLFQNIAAKARRGKQSALIEKMVNDRIRQLIAERDAAVREKAKAEISVYSFQEMVQIQQKEIFSLRTQLDYWKAFHDERKTERDENYEDAKKALAAAKEWEACATQRLHELVKLAEKLSEALNWVRNHPNLPQCNELIDILQPGPLPNGARPVPAHESPDANKEEETMSVTIEQIKDDIMAEWVLRADGVEDVHAAALIGAERVFAHLNKIMRYFDQLHRVRQWAARHDLPNNLDRELLELVRP